MRGLVLVARRDHARALGERDPAQEVLSSQLSIAGFCTLTFLAISALFTLLGRLLGQAFEGLPRLAAYGWNIAGSLAGTWLVSAVAIAVVLVLIVAANGSVALFGPFPYALLYAALAAALLVGYAVEPGAVLGKGLGWSLAYAFLLLLPVYFAGTIFSRSFAGSPRAGAAMGFNILGAVLGGWLEYVTMHTGIRSLMLLALALYGLSALCLVVARPRNPRLVAAAD